MNQERFIGSRSLLMVDERRIGTRLCCPAIGVIAGPVIRVRCRSPGADDQAAARCGLRAVVRRLRV